jgi:Acetoacetate decarboxylase (ADC)
MLAVRMPEPLLERGSFVPPSLAGKRSGRISYVMLVDYLSSNCGPYRELLVIPAAFAIDGQKCATITRIYVSSHESVVNGRRNWGLPKERADFALVRALDGSEQVCVTRDRALLAELSLRGFGPSVPVLSGLFPGYLRRVFQPWRGHSYRFAYRPKGMMRLAKLGAFRCDPALFPDLARGRVLFALHLPRFEMEFSRALVAPGTGSGA